MKKIIKLLSKCFQSISLFKLNLGNMSVFKEDQNLDADFEFKILDMVSESDSLNYIIQQRGEQYGITTKERLNTNSHLCFVFINRKNNESAYCRWLRLDSFFHEKYNKQIILKEKEAFTLDSYTPNKYRSLGLHKEMNKRMLNYCKQSLKLQNVFMVIYNGKEFKHLHKTVYEMGYKKISTRHIFSLRPIFQIISK